MIAVKCTKDNQDFDVYFIDPSPVHMWNFPAFLVHPKWGKGIEAGLNQIWELWNEGEKFTWYCALCKKASMDVPTLAACVFDSREMPLSPATPMICLACSNGVYTAIDADPPAPASAGRHGSPEDGEAPKRR